ncbi:MAG: hypothetical protein ACE15B_20485 [Bryobacteraceae bacterium]
MKLGAEPKKVAILGGLVVAGAYLFYTNVLSGPGAAPTPAPARQESPEAAPVPPRAADAEQQPAVRRTGSRTRSAEEWRPSLKRRPNEKLDPMTIDPSLRLDLLAKVQNTTLEGGSRSIFQFSAPPPPPLPKGAEPKIMPKIPGKDGGQPEAAKAESGPPKPPPPPPISLKYYGYSTVRNAGRKTAFFLDGEDILVAREGELVKRRYKVVRIGVNSVVMEDTESKSQQTLPLAEESIG